MKSQTLEFKVCDSSIGYHARKVTLGPESDLVKAFLENGLEGKGYSFASERMAVFIEPKIDSGFPDIVLAEYNHSFFDIWNDARNELSCDELRMLSYLYSVEGADFSKIRGAMRVNAVSAAHSLELLIDADLIDRDLRSRVWRPRPLDEAFGVKRLIAIEAKVRNNDVVLEQASLNRWFASESYALTPVAPQREFKDRAHRVGVGMVTVAKDRTFRKCVGARRFLLPSSYASWQFNEWIGRRLASGGLK